VVFLWYPRSIFRTIFWHWALKLIAMTQCSSKRRHKLTPFFFHQLLVRVSYKSGTGFVWYQIPALIRTQFCSKRESGVHCTRLRNTKVCNKHACRVHKWKLLLSVQSNAQHWSEYKITLMRLFSVPAIFLPDAYGMKNWRHNGVNLWHRFLEHVSWILMYNCLLFCLS